MRTVSIGAGSNWMRVSVSIILDSYCWNFMPMRGCCCRGLPAGVARTATPHQRVRRCGLPWALLSRTHPAT
eukprot:6991811-Pyramimonas_sp.AAC.1